MEFRTIIDLPDKLPTVCHDEPIMLLGSCFSDNIGERLRRALFDVTANPFGTLYNPASIASAISRLADNVPFSADELTEYGGMWHSFAHHSRFSSVDQAVALEKINREFLSAARTLTAARTVVVTFGTAFVYRLAENGRTVANCHKLPAKFFSRTKMTETEIVGLWIPLLDRLFRINPRLNVVFTVSPIRHLADGAHQNRLSKATLLLAADRLTRHDDRCSYFPAYEIMDDELRDYRFYAADMVHPSEIAADYIMERFAESCFPPSTRQAAAICAKLTRQLRHRPLTDNREAIEKFNASTRQAALDIAGKLPYLRQTIENLISK